MSRPAPPEIDAFHRVASLRHLGSAAGGELREEDARAVFAMYAPPPPRPQEWDGDALRSFLLDLLEAQGRDRVAPDEAVVAAVRELQLSADGESVSWIEWKSYATVLQQRPLERLVAAVDAAVPPRSLDHAVTVSNLPAGATEELVRGVFEQPSCGALLAVHVLEREALVCFAGPDDADRGEMLDGFHLLDSVCAVRRRRKGAPFPSPGAQRNPSRVARSLARIVLGARRLDERAGVSRAVSKAAMRLSQAAEEHKVADAARGAASTIAEQTRRFDERFGVSEQGRRVGAAASAATESVVATAPFQAVSAFLSNVYDRAFEATAGLASDTSAAIAEGERQGRPPEEFELEEEAGQADGDGALQQRKEDAADEAGERHKDAL